MLPFSSNAHFSAWQMIRDPYVRSGIYTWLLIAGLCVLVGNVIAGSM